LSRNLKVVFHLLTEMIIPDHPIPFDALIIKAKAVKDGFSLDEDPNFFSPVEVPIERHSQFPSLYLASVGFVRSSGRNAQFYTKRYYRDVPEKIDITGGFYKAYHVKPYTLAPPATVTFYVRGEKALIEELVPYIPALGPKRSHGYGKVGEIEIAEIPEDRSWIYKDQPMRAIPVRYYKEKLTDWYYTLINPIPPSYTSYQTELCYLPYPRDWISIVPFRQDDKSSLPHRPEKVKRSGGRTLWDKISEE
jgi:hypothetical protein